MIGPVNAIFGWFVLALVLVDELLAMAAFGVWGWEHDPRWLLVWLLPALAMTVWLLLASPKAPFGHPPLREVVRVVVLGLAVVALAHAGHEWWALALLVFSVAVNGLALLPSIRVLVERE